MNYKLFKRDLFEESVEFNVKSDIIIMDLPYNNLVNYKGNYSKTNLEKRIVSLAHRNTIIAVIRNKAQKITIGSNLYKLEKIKTGKRVIEILKNAVGNNA